jgi:hypothetical protein
VLKQIFHSKTRLNLNIFKYDCKNSLAEIEKISKAEIQMYDRKSFQLSRHHKSCQPVSNGHGNDI